MPRRPFTAEVRRIYDPEPGKTNADKKAEINRILIKNSDKLLDKPKPA